jgi:hypothetical protein
MHDGMSGFLVFFLSSETLNGLRRSVVPSFHGLIPLTSSDLELTFETVNLVVHIGRTRFMAVTFSMKTYGVNCSVFLMDPL